MKKALGIIMILAGAFFSIPFLATVYQFFHRPVSTTPQRWQAVGFFLGTTVSFAIILALLTFGILLVRTPRKNQE